MNPRMEYKSIGIEQDCRYPICSSEIHKSLGEDPVSTGVMNAHLTLVLGIGVNVVSDELSSLSDGISALGTGKDGINMAASVECAVIWESVMVGNGDGGNGGKDEGLHI